MILYMLESSISLFRVYCRQEMLGEFVYISLSPLVNLTQKKFISYILVIFSFAHSSLNICLQILLAVTRTTKH